MRTTTPLRRSDLLLPIADGLLDEAFDDGFADERGLFAPPAREDASLFDALLVVSEVQPPRKRRSW